MTHDTQHDETSKDNDGPQSKQKHGSSGSYARFFAMIATSMVVMFFLMYLHSYQILDHAWFSETRLFMTIIMGGGMIVVMLLYMLHMYKSKAKNLATIGAATVLMVAGIFLVRSQITVSDTDYMEGMIPHHSIAILTSTRARIDDPRVRTLADEIIKAQRREIKEMEWLIADIRKNGVAKDQADAEARPVPKFDGTPE
jgi:heme/copper-type cytochrome/quinol oxidase subunit 4